MPRVGDTVHKFILCRHCGECQEPIPLDVCSELGYNPGTDGHMFDSKQEAIEVRANFLLENNRMAMLGTGFDGRRHYPMTEADISVYEIVMEKVA